jgi:hypothetical protein
MDVCSAKLSWSRPQVRGYEVKVTRADFLADTTNGKYRRYLEWCDLFYFATPAGLVAKDEVPVGCGLVVRGPNGWSGVKAPRGRGIDEHGKLSAGAGTADGVERAGQENAGAGG